MRSFPSGGNKRQISTNGGVEPRWRKDGRELFYLAADQTIVAVPVHSTESTFDVGMPVVLFQTRTTALGNDRNHYDVTSDGQRFLVNTVSGSASDLPITVVLNWTAGLRR